MNKKVFDVEEVLNRVQDDNDLLLELLEIFEEYYPERRGALQEMLEKKDFAQIKDVIHSIKGATGNISANVMHAICVKIEEVAQQKDLQGVEVNLEALDKQFVELQGEIDKVKKDLNKG